MAVDPTLTARVQSYFSSRSRPAPGRPNAFANLPTQWAKPVTVQDAGGEAPQNVGQWLLNLLGTGTYATANIGQEYGAGGKKIAQGDLAGGLAQLAGAPLVGLGRGVGEGIGMRFDRDGDGITERPRTWGQNLEESGAFNAMGLGGEGGEFARGAIGTVADIALDPTTYLTLGAGAAIKGAFKGGAEVIKGVEGAAGNVATGAVKGAQKEWLNARTVAQDARAAKVENRQLRADFQQQIRDGLLTKKDIPVVKSVLARAGVSRADLTPEIMSAVEQGLKATKVAPPVGDELVAEGLEKLPIALGGREAADALVPRLKGSVKAAPTPEEVQALFKGAITRPTPVKTPKAAPTISAAADTAVRRIADELTTRGDVDAVLTRLGSLKGGDALLKASVKVGERTVKARQLLVDMFERRASGAAPRPEHTAALEGLLRQAGGSSVPTPPAAVFNPTRLSELVAEKYGRTLTQQDMQRFLSAPNTDKLDVLGQIVGGRAAVSYSDFAEALAGASRGELSLAQMRKMAEAVGVTVPAGAKALDVRSLLKTEGEFNWARISGALRDEGEVLTDLGVSVSDELAAKAIDTDAVKAALASEFGAKIGPKTGSRRGQGAFAAIRALGEDWAKRADRGTESFDLLSNKTMRVIFSAAARAMQPTSTKLTGTDRALFGAELTEVIRLVEEWADSVGSMPHIYGDSFRDTWFVRFSDIIDNLGPDVSAKALFEPLTYRNVPSSSGLSIYPTTIAHAAAEALKHAEQGFEPEQIAFAVTTVIVRESGKVGNEFVKTPAGRVAVENLATRMAAPDFADNLLRIHAARKPVATAMSMKVADRTVTPIGAAVIKALEKAAGGGDRAEVFALIDVGWNAATLIRGGKTEGHLVDELTRERLNNGFLQGVLGEAGARIFKADARTARANNPKNAARSASEAADAAKAAEEQLRRVGPRSGPEGAANTARRGQQAKAGTKNLDDAADVHAEALEDMITRGEIEDTPLARIEALFELEMAYGNARILHKLGVALEGSYGQADLKGLVTAVNGNTFRLSGIYAEDMVRWAGKIGYKQNPAAVARWWNALARVPDGATDDEIRALLTGGQRANPDNPLAREAIAPIPADEVERALELKQFIDVIFSPGSHGLFARSGVVSADLADELRRINFKDGAEKWAKFDLDRSLSLADQAGIWRTWGLESADDPLDVLVRYHTAIQATSVKPSVGSSFGRHFGHAAMGLTEKQAIDAGMVKVDTTAEGADLARFVDPDAYFDKAIVKQMTYTQEFLNASRRFEGKLGQFMDVYDSVLSVLKSSNTLWRPGHHVTNILGETFMNFMAGVNPMRYAKGIAAMRAGGHLTDADPSPLAKYNASNTPAGYEIKESFGSDAVQIVVNVGGKKQVQSIDPATIWQAALDHSVAMTHGLAEDILSPTMQRLNPSLGRQALSPVIETNTALARFSAARDNVFRMTHFVDALEKGQFSSLDDAFRRAAKIVHDYHPTMQTLSAVEQKYARRLVFFYTWQRQAIARVLKTALDRPSLVTFPSKMMYNMAEANGLEPESFGAPAPNDDRIPSYGKNSLLGPSFEAGMTPFDEGTNLWGFSMSAPQIDGIQSLFKGMTFKPEDGVGNVGNVLSGVGDNLAGQLPPLLKAPIELAAHNKVADGGAIDDVGEYLLAQTGLPNQLNTVVGNAAKDTQSTEQNTADQMRALLNLTFGVKLTNYTSDSAMRRAQQELLEQQKKIAGID